jgi:hypothetical protein
LPGPEICFPASTSKKFGQFWKKFGQVHKNLNAAFSSRVCRNKKNFSLSLSVCQKKFFRKFSSAPFLPLLVNFGQNSAMNSFGQLFLFPAPFELFGRNFRHLATLKRKPALAQRVSADTRQFSVNFKFA